MKPILEVAHVGKKYRISHRAGPYLSFRERLLQSLSFDRTEAEDFWALNDVSFSVMPGESIGIIGRNGAGKSTLLKILSKITPPTTGRIVSRGRIASLLEVGTGFHPELTGRENVFLNGSLLGMKRKEIELKFDEIVAFSGVEKFLDTPLKHYSSGMQLRLAFAVAAFLEPEILIIDEVLAVGDAEFQKKCLGKMEDVSKSGRTILFVSHNMAAVENLCSHGMLLKDGRLVEMGRVGDVTRSYQTSFAGVHSQSWVPAKGADGLCFTSIEITLKGEQPTHSLQVQVKLASNRPHAKAFVAFDIVNSMGSPVLQAIPRSAPFIEYRAGEIPLTVTIQLPPLIPDTYSLSAWVGAHHNETYAWERDVVSFEITESPIKGRNFPHSHHNGLLIAHSDIQHG